MAAKDQASVVKVVWVSPKTLTSNPENSEIYSSDPVACDELKRQILDDGGIRDPLIVAEDTKVVLDGNRRLAIALESDFEKVPVVYVPAHDTCDILYHSISHNARKRKLTKSEYFRAINMLWPELEQRIQKEPGAGQMSHKLKFNRTRDAVGFAVGLDGRSAERYRKTWRDLEKCAPGTFARIKNLPDCFELALQIIKEHNRTTASPQARDMRLEVMKTLDGLKSAVEQAAKLQGLTSFVALADADHLGALAIKLSEVSDGVSKALRNAHASAREQA
jgi:ParB-like chromosome segregation protein Spo0J